MRELAGEVLSDRAYQTDLPEGAEPRREIPFRLGGFARLLVYVLVGYALVLMLTWAINEFVLVRRVSFADSRAARAAPRAVAEAGVASHDPDWLAGRERYQEAVHALLLLAIKHLSAAQAVPPGPSTTSRELVRLLPRTPEERQAFGELVGRVELSLFGGRPVGSDDYVHSRRCLERIRPLEAS